MVKKPDPHLGAAIVIFGAKGDLCSRKLIPALYNLFITDHLPASFTILCIDHTVLKPSEYLEIVLHGVNTFSRSGKPDKAAWNTFSKSIKYIIGDFTKSDLYEKLVTHLNEFDQATNTRNRRLYYFSVAPGFIENISEGLFKHKIANNKKLDRLIIEKPFGTDLKSAKALNAFLLARYSEKQIYRIDHYLGKETVQNIMVFRFANSIFEPLWNYKYIDSIEISVLESVAVGNRGGYYDQAGALKDMIQNHLLQLLCTIAMEAPQSIKPEEIREKKLNVLKSIIPLTADRVKTDVIRGQYYSGIVQNQPLPSYRNETKVNPSSNTETYFAGKFLINNARWQNVPIYIRTGKALSRQSSTIVINFKPTPFPIFPRDCEPNKLIFTLQPENEIKLEFESKVPGVELNLRNVEMDFTYKHSYQEAIPEAYETLILDALEGEATLYMRADQVEQAWKIVMPIINTWKQMKKSDLVFYEAGTHGPVEADRLLAKDKRKWTIKI